MEKKLWYRSNILLAFLFFTFSAQAQVRSADFHYLDHLEGYWKMQTKHSVFTEKWHRENENIWKGVTFRITGKDSVKMDDLELTRTGNDIIFSVVGLLDANTGKAVPFKLTVIKEIGFVAENAACDYPQKVVYKFKDAKHMEAHFKGTKEKTFSEIILQYTR